MILFLFDDNAHPHQAAIVDKIIQEHNIKTLAKS